MTYCREDFLVTYGPEQTILDTFPTVLSRLFCLPKGRIPLVHSDFLPILNLSFCVTPSRRTSRVKEGEVATPTICNVYGPDTVGDIGVARTTPTMVGVGVESLLVDFKVLRFGDGFQDPRKVFVRNLGRENRGDDNPTK